MGKSRNVGQDNSLVVFGNPESFKKLIKNHGQLAKVKQALPCPCAADNGGSPNFLCPICRGNGFVYSYQRRFFVADEQTQSNKCVTELYPYYVPVIEVVKAERIVSEARAQACQILEESAEQSRVSALERQKAVRAEYLAEKESMLNGAREEYAALRKAKEKNVPSVARKIFSEIISL